MKIDILIAGVDMRQSMVLEFRIEVMEMIKIFKDMSDSDLKSIWEKYVRAKEVGKTCESFREYARKWKNELYSEDTLQFSGLVIAVEQQFFEEIAKRYFEKE